MQKRVCCILLSFIMLMEIVVPVRATTISGVKKEQQKTQNNLNSVNQQITAIQSDQAQAQEELDQLQGRYPQLRTVKKENQGHGATILYGYRCAIAEGADYIFQTDSDGQTLPEEFWKLWEDRKKCGLLIGSRKKRQDGWRRIFVTRVLRLVILVTFHCWVEDANTPFRLMRAAELEEVLTEIPPQYFLANVLMTVRYTKEGRRVMYYPITFRPRQGGVNSINMKKIVKIGKTTLKDFRKWGGAKQ